MLFAVANCLWSVVFVEYWKRQEIDLAVRWGVRNVSQLQNKRAQFQYEKEVEDPVTGEVVKYFPAWKRLCRQLLQIPFALGASSALSALYASVFAIEILISEVYNGPFKSGLVGALSRLYIYGYANRSKRSSCLRGFLQRLSQSSPQF
jgi:anoctamin-10